jgi:hypothetical protein
MRRSPSESSESDGERSRRSSIARATAAEAHISLTEESIEVFFKQECEAFEFERAKILTHFDSNKKLRSIRHSFGKLSWLSNSRKVSDQAGEA